MPDNKVEISYEAFVKGLDSIKELSARTQELQTQNDKYKQKIDELSKAHDRHETALQRARKSIIAFRRELFAISFTAAAVAGTLKLLSGGSEALAERLENLGTKIKNAFAPAGSFIAKLLGNKGQISAGTEADILTLQSETARLRGDEYTSLIRRQEAERVKLLRNATEERKRLIEGELRARQEAEREAFRLAELGLKNQLEIARQFKRDLVGAFTGGTSDTIFKFLQGERQSVGDVVKSFTSGFNRAIADAISQSLATTLFQGGNFFENFMNILKGKNATVQAIEKSNESLQRIEQTNARIAECACFTAENIANAGSSRPTSMTIEAPKKSGIQKAAEIFGTIGSIAGGFGGIPMPTAPMPTTSTPPIAQAQSSFPTLSIDPSVYMPKMASGGEVPILAHRGEYVVRGPAAAENKDLLRDINQGGRPMSGAPNVFIINAVDAKSFADQLSSPSARAQIEIQVIRAIMANGQSRNVIKQYTR